MKNKLIFLVLNLLCILSFSQTIKLDYVPQSGVIKFYFNNLICYTDTTSLFARHQSDTSFWEFEKTTYREIDNIVRRQLMKDDTVVFTKNFYYNNEELFPGERVYDWRVWDDIKILTRTNKVLIFDSYGNRVQKVQIKQEGRIRECGGGKYFISKDTKEVLFLYERKGHQRVCLGEVSTY